MAIYSLSLPFISFLSFSVIMLHGVFRDFNRRFAKSGEEVAPLTFELNALCIYYLFRKNTTMTIKTTAPPTPAASNSMGSPASGVVVVVVVVVSSVVVVVVVVVSVEGGVRSIVSLTVTLSMHAC